jgi:hypothetical protein
LHSKLVPGPLEVEIPLDAELVELILSWPTLTKEIQREILQLGNAIWRSATPYGDKPCDDKSKSVDVLLYHLVTITRLPKSF